MSGKPTIPPTVHSTIRMLSNQGVGRKAIAEKLGGSGYTIRKALDPDFVERERERQRRIDRSARRKDPAYLAYQAAWSASPERREQLRGYRAAGRRNNKTAAT